jgi:hypothetical protein
VDLALRIFSVATGSALVFLIMTDVFQSVILPRAATFNFRLSSRLTRTTWPLARSFALARIADEERREDFLALYAPLVLVTFIGMWVGCSILGFGAIFYALRESVRDLHGFGDALYFAGTSLLTIGYGDLVPLSGATRFVSICTGAAGLGVMAVTTAFLFSLFGSFQNREIFVVAFGSRAGSPSSGVTLLETYARLGIPGELSGVFENGLTWTATVLESHLAYPILGYFRSSHDRESWVATLGALLDASALASTVVDDRAIRAHASLYLEMGSHAIHDLAGYYRLDVPGEPGIERAEFDAALERLRDAGLPIAESVETCWTEFGRIRSRYAASLQAMAHFWAIPPAMWIGDRSALPHGMTLTSERATSSV